MKVELLPPLARSEVHYPDSDGKPMGETPRHIRNMFYALYPVQTWFEKDDMVFAAANMFVYYVKGDPGKHVSPDLFVAKNVPKEKTPEWRKYLVWEEGKGPDLVIEFTSESTRDEDLVKKLLLYRDVLKVQEYFLFDPWDEYLVPRLQGYRLVDGSYQAIQPVDGRLPSEVLGLHLEAEGELLRFVDPKSGKRLPIPTELADGWKQAEAQRQQAETQRQQAETQRQQEEFARKQAEADLERLRREMEELRKRLPNDGSPG